MQASFQDITLLPLTSLPSTGCSHFCEAGCAVSEAWSSPGGGWNAKPALWGRPEEKIVARAEPGRDCGWAEGGAVRATC